MTPVLIVMVVIYFGYHFVQGKYGLLSWQRLNTLLEERQAYLEILTHEEEKLQHYVSLIGDKVDADYLDEEARKQLGYSRKNEVIIHRD